MWANRIYESGRIPDYEEEHHVRPVQPVRDLSRRAPEHGRIRIGVKTAQAMKSIDKLRFTSPDREAIETLAQLHGGEAEPWNEQGRNEWQVITESREIPVILPPDPLQGTPIYELWSGGGIQRRCDGVTVEIPEQTPDGVEMVDSPCICQAKGKMDCRVITRISVILPEVKFAGTWRLETKSWNAASEMPEMVDAIMTVQGAGFTRAVLGVAQREKMALGKKKKFVVPYLRLDGSINELAAGAAQMAGIPGSPSPAPAIAIEAGGDEGPVEAEIVYDDLPQSRTQLLSDIAEIATKQKMRETDLVAFASHVSDGKCRLITELNDEQLNRVALVFDKIHNGVCVYTGVSKKDGHPIVQRLVQREESG